MREAWDWLMGLLLHDRENERVLIYMLVLGVVGLVVIYSRFGIGDGGGGDGGDGGGEGC
jgi:hypothetical protein